MVVISPHIEQGEISDDLVSRHMSAYICIYSYADKHILSSFSKVLKQGLLFVI